jgi:hypothetical protein
MGVPACYAAMFCILVLGDQVTSSQRRNERVAGKEYRIREEIEGEKSIYKGSIVKRVGRVKCRKIEKKEP